MTSGANWLLLDLAILFAGALFSRVVFSSIFKLGRETANGLTWCVGLMLGLSFYATWAATGMEPIQLSICRWFASDAPACVEKRELRALLDASRRDKGSQSDLTARAHNKPDVAAVSGAGTSKIFSKLSGCWMLNNARVRPTPPAKAFSFNAACTIYFGERSRVDACHNNNLSDVTQSRFEQRAGNRYTETPLTPGFPAHEGTYWVEGSKASIVFPAKGGGSIEYALSTATNDQCAFVARIAAGIDAGS
jgi:hypothetical protein